MTSIQNKQCCSMSKNTATPHNSCKLAWHNSLPHSHLLPPHYYHYCHHSVHDCYHCHHISPPDTQTYTYSKEILEVQFPSSELACDLFLLPKLVHNPFNGHDLPLIEGLSTTCHGLHTIGRELLQPLPQLVEGLFTARRRGRGGEEGGGDGHSQVQQRGSEEKMGVGEGKGGD